MLQFHGTLLRNIRQRNNRDCISGEWVEWIVDQDRCTRCIDDDIAGCIFLRNHPTNCREDLFVGGVVNQLPIHIVGFKENFTVGANIVRTKRHHRETLDGSYQVGG